MNIPNITELKLMIDSTSHRYNASQIKLSYPIVRRLCLKMKMGIRFKPIHVAEGMIIDGHHRYIAAILASQEVTVVPTLLTSATRSFLWNLVELDPEDWDSPGQIEAFNRLDGASNDIDPQLLQKLTQ